MKGTVEYIGYCGRYIRIHARKASRMTMDTAVRRASAFPVAELKIKLRVLAMLMSRQNTDAANERRVLV